MFAENATVQNGSPQLRDVDVYFAARNANGSKMRLYENRYTEKMNSFRRQTRAVPRIGCHYYYYYRASYLDGHRDGSVRGARPCTRLIYELGPVSYGHVVAAGRRLLCRYRARGGKRKRKKNGKETAARVAPAAVHRKFCVFATYRFGAHPRGRVALVLR